MSHDPSCSCASVSVRLGSARSTAVRSKQILSIPGFRSRKTSSTRRRAIFRDLLRAADLIGQLADIYYLRKTSALFTEFRETGMNEKLKYNSPADLRANYPQFFWQVVRPYIEDGLQYLRVTQEGKQSIANLYANAFSIEHTA